MADIYDRAKASAARMLAPRSKGGKGLELSLLQIANGEYDPETGTGGETITTFEGSGFRENYSLKDIDGSLIKQGDVKILISPLLLDGADTPKPTTQDKLLFDGETYTVQAVDPWSYAGLVVGFSVQARK
ncbi:MULTISPECIES: hypothetical protein [Pseudomonas]|uniref:hypothetical protein n=1 Tax=Pseudomonas TaxID=286 RepID=UPI0005AADBEC|nr:MULTISPECIES: hypothetical protein [Pseudomonas]AZD93024.1 hypothetical protein C4K13_3607 [Pseudomonas chlororaphis subsp. aureofaciens]KAB0532811.1 hypothetical protein F7R16_11255 [Pseudomonas chlororaphis subsp. aureofaciens]TSD26001.1 hypothetical protein FCE86_031535 [Pseudomonas sp. ATCC 13985]UUT22155.1 hypothetical protein NRG23_31460 [Pseudomonas sp. T8]WDG57823.1 hypothetical protein PUP52_18425 [Pseudomonas chlororaphis]